ncbi:hypothetical protein [Pseudothermotoga sp.]
MKLSKDSDHTSSSIVLLDREKKLLFGGYGRCGSHFDEPASWSWRIS